MHKNLVHLVGLYTLRPHQLLIQWQQIVVWFSNNVASTTKHSRRCVVIGDRMYLYDELEMISYEVVTNTTSQD
jgi:hypothetical protein